VSDSPLSTKLASDLAAADDQSTSMQQYPSVVRSTGNNHIKLEQIDVVSMANTNGGQQQRSVIKQAPKMLQSTIR
jgi:hypothetical protein